MKRAFRVFLTTLKWSALVLLGVEVASFFVLTLANLFVYGSVWEGSRVQYDPYTLFQEGIRPTAHNPAAAVGREGGGPVPIWMFGGSTMRGATDDDTRTIPSYLAGLLNGRGGQSGYLVRNYGENSFNSLLETRYLQKALIEETDRPGILVFYDGVNESVYFSQHRSPGAHHGYNRVRALIESHRRSLWGLLKPLNAAVYASFSWELWDKLNQTVIPMSPDSPELRDFVHLAVQRYDYVNAQAELYGATFLLIWQPALWVEECTVDPRVAAIEEKLPINRARFLAVRHNFQVIKEALAAELLSRPYFVDFRQVLCARTEQVYQHDGVHLQDAGRAIVAQAMLDVFLDRGLATPSGQR